MKYQLTSKIIKCKCTKDYLFHKTKDFSGVLFKSDEIYSVDVKHIRYKLISVSKSNPEVHVGMSLKTFKEHFEIVKDESLETMINYINKIINEEDNE